MNWRVSAESNCTLNWQINAEVLLIALMLVCPLADGPAQLALKNSFCAGCKYTSLFLSPYLLARSSYLHKVVSCKIWVKKKRYGRRAKNLQQVCLSRFPWKIIGGRLRNWETPPFIFHTPPSAPSKEINIHVAQKHGVYESSAWWRHFSKMRMHFVDRALLRSRSGRKIPYFHNCLSFSSVLLHLCAFPLGKHPRQHVL